MDRGRNLTRKLDILEQDRFYVGKDGGFGEVFGAFLMYGRPVVVKRIRDTDTIYGRSQEEKIKVVAREAGIWERLSHPNLLPLYGYAMCEELSPLRLFISPYVPGGDLASYVDRHPNLRPPERGRLITEVAFGIKYLHTFDPPISHGDMKPNNVLVSHCYDPVVKIVKARPLICDFGLARVVTEDRLQTTSLAQGAPVYRAWEFQFLSDFRKMYPDQLQRDDQASMLTGLLKGDIWGWAMTALRIFLGREPFPADRNHQLWERCRKRVKDPCKFNVSRCERNGMTYKFLDAMKQSWEWNPKDRPEIGEIIALLGAHEPNLLPEDPTKAPSPYPPATSYVANGRPIHFFVRAKRRSHADPAKLPQIKDCMMLQTEHIVAVRDISPDGWWQGKCVYVKSNAGVGLVKPANVSIAGDLPKDPNDYFSVVTLRDQDARENEMLQYQRGAQLFVRRHGSMYIGFEPLPIKGIQGQFPCNYVDTYRLRHLRSSKSNVLFYAQVKEAFRGQLRETLETGPEKELHFEQDDLIGVTKAPNNGRWEGVLMRDEANEGIFSRDAVEHL